MNDMSVPSESVPAAILPEEATVEVGEETVQAERLERRISKILDLEHASEFVRIVRSLPPGEALKTYRSFFTAATEQRSLILVRVSLKKLSHQALVSALPRIASSRPDIARELAQAWLDIYADVLGAMLGGFPLPEDVSTDVLSAVQFVLEGELPENEESGALTTALRRASQLQEDCTLWQAKHAAVQAEVTRLNRETGHLGEKLRRAEERTKTTLRQEREQAARRAEREQRRAQQTLEASERELEAQQARYEQELADLRRSVERLEQQVRSGETDRSRHLGDLLTRERADSVRLRARHAQQLKEMHGTVAALQEELAAHTAREEQVFDEDLLDDALVISYATAGTDAVQRLTALFELYAAFLQGHRAHDGLVRQSNIGQFGGRRPSGILLLGLEQLLLDGVNVPLTRYLKMRGLRQEAMLHQLVGRLDSPRLAGTP